MQHGNLSSVRTFLDTEDACNAYWLTAKKGIIGEIYNISGDKVISVKDFLKNLIIQSKIKTKIKTRINAKLVRKTDVSYQIANNSKFKKHTKWKPKIKFKDSIKKILDHFDKEV